MIGFQPYETFQLLIETGGIERANTLLVAACDAFARRANPSRSEAEQFEALVTRLFPTAAPTARARAAALLASAPKLSPELELLMIENLGAGLIPHIEAMPSLSDDLVYRLIEKGDVEVVAAIARRPDLSNGVLARLFAVNSRKVYRALADNLRFSPRGAFLTALTRSAEMDHEVAASLARRPDFDAALLTAVFFDLPEDGRLDVIRAYAKRNLPQTPLMRTFEEISVATGEFTTALMKLFAENRRPKITRLLHQVTGLDEVRCGEIAHDTSGAALFVVLRAFGCTAYDGLKVLIHATSHDGDRSRALAAFARLFEDVSVASMVYVMSAWRGDVALAELTKPGYAPFAPRSARTPARAQTKGDKALEALDGLKSARKAS
ncbi:DUF2336 domain-containing protein [Pelagibacterium lacus]|uniref:DUF2336 domain-containing protein n=1 Tax=Pelagibacterium lacus TaxID=2282655 RepID=A0A369W829_9HYPH|nr:DUF2336 domain-containing protein [Pelagibacterium lacus]RDE10493.1 DUF2336 domain-containing protein [Pelagibacterium lacus]